MRIAKINFADVCRTLKKMTGRNGWKAQMQARELRLISPPGDSYSPLEALFVFLRQHEKASFARVTSWRLRIEEARRVLGPKLGLHPFMTLSVLLSAGGRRLPAFHGLQQIYASEARRQALITACGLKS